MTSSDHEAVGRAARRTPPHRGEPVERDDYRCLIQALLRQTPEERLEGLRRSAAFFRAARRV